MTQNSQSGHHTAGSVTTSRKIVLSASRRTDIPAFYMEWMMDRIARGFFEIINPYNHRASIRPVSPAHVHTIVFWSKNFGPFIRKRYGERLRDAGFHLFFNFTVNSESTLLEPNVPPLNERLRQMEILGHRFDPRSLIWRFDPICFYRTSHREVEDNLRDFSTIAKQAAASGIQKCVTSFMDFYPKIRKRASSIPDFSFLDPPLTEKRNILSDMAQKLEKRNIRLYTCCEKDVLAEMPQDANVEKGACIPNDLIMDLYGGRVSVSPDRGQRISQGCGCMESVDIGSYSSQPCFHSCLFCYANPAQARSSSTAVDGCGQGHASHAFRRAVNPGN